MARAVTFFSPCPQSASFRRRRTARRAALAAIAAFALALEGCGGGDSAAGGRTIAVGVDSNPTSLDPRLSQDAISWQIQRLLFRQLLAYDAAGALVLDAAEAWEASPLSHRFRLKEGIRFHDGSPLTSADVKYTFDSLREPAMGSPKAAGLKEQSFRHPVDAGVDVTEYKCSQCHNGAAGN